MYKSSAAPSRTGRNIKAYIISVIIGLVFSGLILLFFSLVTWLLQLPISYSEIFSALAFGAGCLASGIFIGWARRQNGLINGIRAAFLFQVPVFIISIFMSGLTGALLAERFIVAVICGSVGGVIGVNRKFK